MKLFVCILGLVALTQAADDVDWSKVKRFDITPKLPFLPRTIGHRIVGGQEATQHSIPYQVGLLVTASDGTYFCGGSLISTKYVLTAAHCIESAVQVQVRLGAHRINDNEDTQVRMISSTVRVHEGWNSATLTNDIGIIELPEAVTLNENIQLVALPTYSDASNTFAGEEARVSGWGLDSDSATAISDVLRYVYAEVITNFVCNLSYLGSITNSHICIGGAGGVGSCSGDSGGPLVIGNKQIGVVSFGISLGCEIGWPSAFTRTTSYLDWIASHTDVVIH